MGKHIITACTMCGLSIKLISASAKSNQPWTSASRLLKMPSSLLLPISLLLLWPGRSLRSSLPCQSTRRPLLIGSLAAVRLALLLPLRPCAVQVDAVAVAVAPAAALSPSPVHLWNGVYQIIIIIITVILSSIHLSLQVQCDTCQLDRSPVGLDLGSSTILLG